MYYVLFYLEKVWPTYSNINTLFITRGSINEHKNNNNFLTIW